jgi:hypothetical protein
MPDAGFPKRETFRHAVGDVGKADGQILSCRNGSHPEGPFFRSACLAVFQAPRRVPNEALIGNSEQFSPP